MLVKVKDLKRAVDKVLISTANISTTPILENILIEKQDNKLFLYSNDLNTGMKAEVPIIEDNENKEFLEAVSSKILSQYLSLLEADRIEITKKENSIILKVGKEVVRIATVNGGDFPKPLILKEEEKKEIEKITFIKKDLEKAFLHTLFSSAEENIRPTLAGVEIKVNVDNKTIDFNSTDSLRATILSLKIENIDRYKNLPIIILPSRSINKLLKLFAKNPSEIIDIFLTSKQIEIHIGEDIFVSNLLNGKFPEITNFMPKANDILVSIDVLRNKMISALKKTIIFSGQDGFVTVLDFSGEENSLGVYSRENEIGDNKIFLNINKEINLDTGASLTFGKVGLNAKFLLEVLSNLDSDYVNIGIVGDKNPISITPIVDEEDKDKSKTDFKHIIMPIKL